MGRAALCAALLVAGGCSYEHKRSTIANPVQPTVTASEAAARR